MVNTNKLHGKIVEKGYSKRSFAHKIGMSEATFYRKMKSGVFGSDEIEKMIEILDIENPTAIFFDKEVT